MKINDRENCLLCSLEFESMQLPMGRKKDYQPNFKRYCQHGIEIVSNKEVENVEVKIGQIEFALTTRSAS